MAKITALLHTHDNDAPCLGQVLDALRSCDQVLVINHGGEEIERIAREHGATTKAAVAGVSPGAYLVDASNDWILCLRANELLSPPLQAALAQWQREEHEQQCAFAVAVREPDGDGDSGRQNRLVNRSKLNWTGELPPNEPPAPLLSGDLLPCVPR